MGINDAEKYMKEKHNGQTRKQGTPYYLHPLAVSKLLKRKGFPEDYQITGLFHDLLEDTDTTYNEILELTNYKIANAVKLLTKEMYNDSKKYNMQEYIDGISKNEMAKMVKLADRIHNLSEAHLTSLKFQNKYIKETEEWYVNLAKNTVFEDDLNFILKRLKRQVYIKENQIYR